MDSAIIVVNRKVNINLNFVDVGYLSVRLDDRRMLESLAIKKAAFMNTKGKFNS